MNDYERFLTSLSSYSKLPNSLDISFIMPNYPRENSSNEPSLIYAGGEITISFPFFCESTGFPSYLLIRTLTGASTVTIEGTTYSSQENNLLFLNCNLHFKISSYSSNWTFQILYLREDFIRSYFSAFNESNEFIYDIKPYSCIPTCFQNIINESSSSTVLSNLYETKWLIDMLTEICVAEQSKTAPRIAIPKYLQKAKEILEDHLDEPFSLEDLAEELHVNKYRLCREFSSHYNMPPLRYLNYQRIQKAKELLFKTNLTITEISTQLGIENVNHFIHLFKKETGTTPLAYKQEAPASIRELYS
ncbi:helix-turn-helix domain-containing protein [Anaerosporobacter sp.]|uniref:helix-turn-helix domain-containing protein n=1 Tax=Anaerosporobacter sp. TaxID=1872529 RepID=UPI00286F153B|nr:AraC family transcriptional regulator [Anaerosporobacter sp.]